MIDVITKPFEFRRHNDNRKILFSIPLELFIPENRALFILEIIIK